MKNTRCDVGSRKFTNNYDICAACNVHSRSRRLVYRVGGAEIWTLRATQGPHGILRSKTLRKSLSWAWFAPHEISPKIMNFHPASRTQNSTFLSSKIIVEDYPLGKLKSNYASDLGKIPKFLGEVKCLMNFPLLWCLGYEYVAIIRRAKYPARSYYSSS